MKIAYLLHWNSSPESGVWRKVDTQVRLWNKYGCKVSVFLITGVMHSYLFSFKEIELKVFHYKNILERMHVWSKALQTIAVQHYDAIYFRYDLFHPLLFKFMNKLPIIIEINTNDVREYCYGKKTRCFYNILTRYATLKMASGFVVVSDELKGVVPSRVRKNRLFCTIANGIDLSMYPELPPARNRAPRLVFIGSPNQVWHGIDKILDLARAFKGWKFDIIGLLELPNSPPNMVFHGFLPRKKYQKLLAQTDVAIGTLALHRNNMNEASPLKVREYLAYGLPVIIGYSDTDFREQVPFILELPNKESNVRSNLVKIKEFVQKWQGKRVVRSVIGHLDAHVKEASRLFFIQGVVERCHREKR